MPLDEELLEPKSIPVHGIVIKENVYSLGVLEPLEAPLKLLKLTICVAVPEVVTWKPMEPEVTDLADPYGIKLHGICDVDDIELFKNLLECLPSFPRLPACTSRLPGELDRIPLNIFKEGLNPLKRFLAGLETGWRLY